MTERAVNAPYATEAHASVFRNADFFSLIFFLLVMCSSRYNTIRTNQARVPEYGEKDITKENDSSRRLIDPIVALTILGILLALLQHFIS
jgi:hypothetical protein